MTLASDRQPGTTGEIEAAHAILAEAAVAIVRCPSPAGKVALATTTARRWRDGQLSLAVISPAFHLPKHPGRPSRPRLLPPREMARRSAHGAKGRFALLHAMAHIELNAVDMTWDLLARFARAPMPRAFFDDWVQVGLEEARHFDLVSHRLAKLGGTYGDLPAHNGLWQAAQATGHDLMARLAVVPLVLEARGLDVSPAMIESLRQSGDTDSAQVLDVIYRDEKRHVACGMRWFRHICQRRRLAPEPTFQALVRANFRGPIKPPFNDQARSEAGLTPGFYKPLSAMGAPP